MKAYKPAKLHFDDLIANLKSKLVHIRSSSVKPKRHRRFNTTPTETAEIIAITGQKICTKPTQTQDATADTKEIETSTIGSLSNFGYRRRRKKFAIRLDFNC